MTGRWFIQYRGFAQGPWYSEEAAVAYWRVDLFAKTHGKVVAA